MRLAQDDDATRDVFGLPAGAPAPRPWRVAAIRHARDVVRVLDARGEKIGRLRAVDAARVVALVNGAACACPEAHEPGCPVVREL